jgi:hypothetical protein
MPVNKNALLRYKIIDRSLRNRYRRWTIEDLVDEVSDALYDMEGIRKGISLRTVQNDIQIMRSDKLGYNAPIEVYDQKYYRYADPDYSITELPLTADDFKLITKAVKMLEKTEGKPELQQMGREMGRVLARVKKRLTAILNYG